MPVLNDIDGDNTYLLDNDNDDYEINDTFGNDAYYFGNGNNTVNDSWGNDYYRLWNGNNTINDGLGHDAYRLLGNGNNTINDGWGNDHYRFGDGNNTVTGSWGSDTYYLGNGHNRIIESHGRDVFVSGAGIDYLDGGNQGFYHYDANDNPVEYSNFDSDTVDYSFGGAIRVDLLNGTASGGYAEGDTLIDIENVIGSDDANGRDWIYGDDSKNEIYGMAGNDILEGGAGVDYIDGGDGWDYARYTRSDTGVIVDLNLEAQNFYINGELADGGDAQGDVLVNIEALVGSDHNDNLFGYQDKNNFIRGGKGDDSITGGSGSDRLFGGDGNDGLSDGSDRTASVHGSDILEGGLGSDLYVYRAGFHYYNEVGSDIDTVSFTSGGLHNIYVSLATNSIIVMDNSHNTVGGITFNDITLFEQFDFFGSGDFNTYSLADLIAAQAPKTFIGTDRFDHFYGTGLDDTVDYSNSDDAVTIDLQATLYGSFGANGGFAEGDYLEQIENVKGSDISSARDILYGNDKSNDLYGLAGNDILEGGAGEDYLDGGDGWDYARYTHSDEGVNINLETGVNTGGHADGDTLVNIEAVTGSDHADTLVGNREHNTFYAGGGDDWMVGGLGQDQFWGFDGADTLAFTDAAAAFERPDFFRDFDASEGDALDISAILIGYDALTDAISDFVSVTDNGTDTFMAVDADGGGDNYITVARLFGVTGLDATTMEADGHLITETTTV